MANHRKRPFQDIDQHFTYVWRLNRKVIYVGYGRNNRGRPTCKASWGGRCKELVDILKTRSGEIKVTYFPQPDRKSAVDLERELIKKLNPKFNKAPQAGGWKGMHTDEGLSRMSSAQKSRKYSEEERKARSVRMIGNQNLLGHKHSEETKKRISESNKGKTLSELGRKLASERMKLRNKTNPPRKGKKCSAAHRSALSLAARNRRKAK